ELQSQMRKLQVEIAEQQARQKALDGLTIPESAVEDQVQRDRLVQQYLKQTTDLEEYIAGLKRVAARGENEPTLRKYEKDLEAARAALDARRKEVRPKVIDGLREKARQETDAALALLQRRATLMKENEKVLGDVIERMRKETQSMNQSGLSLGSLQDDIPRAENLAKMVAADLDALNVEIQAPPRVTLLEAAALAQVDVRKRQLLICGGSALAALFLAVAGVAWWESRSRRVGTVDEVVRGLGVNLIGAVPNVPYRASHSLVPLTAPRDVYWHNVLTESVNAIRTLV